MFCYGKHASSLKISFDLEIWKPLQTFDSCMCFHRIIIRSHFEISITFSLHFFGFLAPTVQFSFSLFSAMQSKILFFWFFFWLFVIYLKLWLDKNWCSYYGVTHTNTTKQCIFIYGYKQQIDKQKIVTVNTYSMQLRDEPNRKENKLKMHVLLARMCCFQRIEWNDQFFNFFCCVFFSFHQYAISIDLYSQSHCLFVSLEYFFGFSVYNCCENKSIFLYCKNTFHLMYHC